MNHVEIQNIFDLQKEIEYYRFCILFIENCVTHPYWIKNGYVKYQNRRHGGYAEYSVNNQKKKGFVFSSNNSLLSRHISVVMVIN